MLSRQVWVLCLAALGARAQEETGTGTGVSTTVTETGSSSSSSSSSSLSRTSSSRSAEYTAFEFTNSDLSTISTTIPVTDFVGSKFTYVTDSGQRTVTSTGTRIFVSGDRTLTLNSENGTASATSNSQITRTTNTNELTQIVGSSNRTMTATGTSSAPAVTNTAACNNYPEFCNRKYSNITEVAAHNAAFAVKNNAGSNQEYSITDQLNDGIRMLQGQVHYINETLYNCHTSCDLLNAGTFQSELETIVAWLQDNPFEVLTMLIGNSDLAFVEEFRIPIENSGISQYLYTPMYIPQHKDQWPTLGEMILNNNRVVMFMDYYANQDSVPYILEEFTHMWETPFSPQNPDFPCTIERPPGLAPEDAHENFMYMANHNLNVAVELGSLTGALSEPLLLPNTAQINNTNGQGEEHGQLGAMAMNCSRDHGAPPNFLLVDYYNRGSPNPGSVFEVAAKWNNVTYNRPCCGPDANPGAVVRASVLAMVAAVGFACLVLW